MVEKVFRSLLSLEDARRAIESNIQYSIPSEEVNIEDSAGRILAEDIISTINVPGFDKSTVDGYAVKAKDTFGANEVNPKNFRLIGRVEPGAFPNFSVGSGEAAEIATGAMLPIGADAVVMVENTRCLEGRVEVYSSVTPGENVMATGTDIMIGEYLLKKYRKITLREVGVLAAVGRRRVKVFGKPKVAIISTGNELQEPGTSLTTARIYDVNLYALAAAVSESYGTPICMGVARDDEDTVKEMVIEGLQRADIVLTSGSTSAGRSDILPRIVSSLKDSKIIAHGLAVKPGKPTLIAFVGGKLLVGLPGNPTSALMIFHELVKPVINRLAGVEEDGEPTIDGYIAIRTFSDRGKEELLPVHIVTDSSNRNFVYPTAGGSGAITTLALADGFIRIPVGIDMLNEGDKVQIHLFSQQLKIPDLTIIGSHCVGVDVLTMELTKSRHLSVKTINVGSLGGLQALGRGEADVAGIHLLDEESGEYNKPFIERLGLSDKVILFRGYWRDQGFIVLKGNPKRIESFEDIIKPGIRFINRNKGSGTRIIIDNSLKSLAEKKGVEFEKLKSQIEGYELVAKSHNSVAAAVHHGRADVGIGIRTSAEIYGLDFIPYSLERFDFAVNKERLNKIGVKALLETLRSDTFKETLKRMPGIHPDDSTGQSIK
jgi:putative molybdopterin biosynthesis protein